MEFNEFREKVKVALPGFLTDDLRNAEIKDTAVNKLQGESYSGISITPEGSRVGVSINLEDAFLDYQTGSQFTAVMNRLADTIVGTLGERNQFDLGFLADYSAVKNMLTVEVVGKDQNAEMLQSVPHQEMEDLAAVLEKIRMPRCFSLYRIRKWKISLQSTGLISVKRRTEMHRFLSQMRCCGIMDLHRIIFIRMHLMQRSTQ